MIYFKMYQIASSEKLAKQRRSESFLPKIYTERIFSKMCKPHNLKSPDKSQFKSSLKKDQNSKKISIKIGTDNKETEAISPQTISIDKSIESSIINSYHHFPKTSKIFLDVHSPIHTKKQTLSSHKKIKTENQGFRKLRTCFNQICSPKKEFKGLLTGYKIGLSKFRKN